MTLRSQMLTFFKELNSEGILGVELEREMFQTSKGGYFSASLVSRTARHLAEEERLKREYDDRGLVVYFYKPSQYERFHQTMI